MIHISHGETPNYDNYLFYSIIPRQHARDRMSSVCYWFLWKHNSDIQCHLSMRISTIESYKLTTKNITPPAHPYSLFATSNLISTTTNLFSWYVPELFQALIQAADLHGLDARCGRYGSQTSSGPERLWLSFGVNAGPCERSVFGGCFRLPQKPQGLRLPSALSAKQMDWQIFLPCFV